MAESQNAVQSAIIERLQAQERVVVKTVDERRQGFSKLGGERLTDSTTKSQAALADLRERLAVIDKAQQNLTELSTQMVGLQDILDNKQARGAFGELQLRDLVRSFVMRVVVALQYFSTTDCGRNTGYTTTCHAALADLRHRPAVINKAQQILTGLSTQVVWLQDVLANTQARGAFCEIHLRDLVGAALTPSAYPIQAT